MVKCIEERGPDAKGSAAVDSILLGHTRLSIIDIDHRANQPMQDSTGRYSLVFNGEIYNYRDLKLRLAREYKIDFNTSSDTEVLLYGLIHLGTSLLNDLNGFFALAFYDRHEEKLILARDRFGIKPLYYYRSDSELLFSSSLKAVMRAMPVPEIDHASLFSYLQLSYIPAPGTILTGVKKMMPATYLSIGKQHFEEVKYYSVSLSGNLDLGKSRAHTQEFRSRLDTAVQRRLMADVPLGTFLSGGFDSSVISLLASKHFKGIPAFSIGFPDHPYFDESRAAEAMAKHLDLEHHIIPVAKSDMAAKLPTILDGIDEPFADSSAILVNLLSEYTRREVKVALSGDGADELMGGYNKHRALIRSSQANALNDTFKRSAVFLNKLPQARHSRVLNSLRKAGRYAEGLHLNYKERYEAWASFTPKAVVATILKNPKLPEPLGVQLDSQDFNTVLLADLDLVLPNDMLHKVDSMSMRHGLEVRVPFLDHELVDFLFRLPANEKVNTRQGKIILREAFKDDFPKGFFERKKKGFEAPLRTWLAESIRELVDQYTEADFVDRQGLFDSEALQSLKRQAFGNYPGDSMHTLWAIIVFQHWYLENMHNPGSTP